MKKILITLFIIIITATLTKGQQTEYYFKFKIDKKTELKKITKIISIDNFVDNTVYAYANEKQLEIFKKKTNYDPEILDHPHTKAKVIDMATSLDQMANWDKYPTYDVYEEMMNHYASNYPSICKLDTIGTTVNGRHLFVLKISDNVDQEEDEPEFFYTSTMHGDETTGFVFMLRFIDSLLTNYGTIPEITDYINNIAIFINPNANPDGTYTDDNSTVSGATRYNANSIDLNRNFPDPEEGNHPDGNNWQPETEAMMAFANKHNFTLSANFHGGAEVANYPWDTWSRRHADDELLQHLSYAYAEPAIANSPSDYFKGISDDGIINGYDWYRVTGSRQDYMTYHQNCREITMEVSDQKLLSSDELRDYWDYNAEALFAFMEQSLWGIRGKVTDENDNPIYAKVELENHDTEDDSSMVFTDPQVGDYHRMIEEGTYNIIFSSIGYYTDTIKNISVNFNDSVRVDISLNPKPSYTINGTITDQENGNPIEDAKVTVLNSETDPVYTNVDGEYTIDDIYEGTQNIQITKSGYATKLTEIFIDESNTTFNFELFNASIEDFETGDFSSFYWTFEGDKDWEIVSDQSYEGSYSAKSGAISDNQETGLSTEIMVKEPGELSFYKKVSSESSYDILKFYIDGNEVDSWSGEIDWSLETYSLSEGHHTLTWKYTKDSYGSNGDDAAWIDYITFPELAPATLSFSPDTLQANMDVNDSQIKTIQLTNGGNEAIDYSIYIENENPWISLSTNNGSIQGMQTEDIEAEINTGSEDSLYSCNIVLTNNETEQDTTIPVYVHADYYPELEIEPEEINEELFVDSMMIKYLSLSNTGTGTLEYNAEIENPEENPWLSIQNTSGTIEEEKDSVKILIDGTKLNEGHYTGNIVINDNSKRGQNIVPVGINVSEKELFEINKEELSTTLQKFEADTLRFLITNTIHETIDIDIQLEDSTNAEIFSLSENQSSIGEGDSAAFDLRINPQGINEGEYSVNLVINSLTKRFTKKLPVNIEIENQEALIVKPDSINVTISEEQNDTTDIILKNQTNFELDYTISDNVNEYSWLSTEKDNGKIPAKDSIFLKCFILTENLSEGNYAANIEIMQSYNDSTYTIPVNLNVEENTTGINEINKGTRVNCYPNPFSNNFNIEIDLNNKQENLSVSLINISGQILYSKQYKNLDAGKNNLFIDVDSDRFKRTENLFLRIKTEEEIIVKKLIYRHD